MKKKILIGSIIAVALIVLSSFSSVVGKISSDDELVEYDVEFCGLGEKSKIYLTKYQEHELERIFNELREKLEGVENREDTIPIINHAISELKNKEILGNREFERLQYLLSGNQFNQKHQKLLENKESKQSEIMKRNLLCFTCGKATNSHFAGPFSKLLTLWWLTLPVYIIAEFWFLLVDFSPYIPLALGCTIGFGNEVWGPMGEHYYLPSEGWIFSIGLLGIKYSTGLFEGNLQKPIVGIPGHDEYRPGVLFFNGLKIGTGVWGEVYYFIGTALKVDIIDT